MPRFHHLAATTAALAAALLLACTSTAPSSPTPPATTAQAFSDPQAAPTNSSTPVATPVVRTTPVASPTALLPDFASEFDPYTRPTAPASPAPAPTRLPPDIGVMVVDPSGPGEHYTLYRGESRVVAYDYFPTFNADGSVWIGTVGGGAVTRFAPDGRELESFDGAHLVMESADGRSRSYSLSGAGALIVERDGVRRTLTGTVVRRAFSPDGHRIAYYVHHDEHYAASLHVLDIPSGETWMLAEDIDPCRCDLTRNPTWSASGDYLAFIDYGDPTRDEPSDYGHYVVSVAGAEPLDVSSFVGWIQIDGVDLLVTNEPPSLHDPRTDSHLPIPIAGADVSYVSGIVDDRLLAAWIDLPSSARAFVLLDPRTGTELARWRHGGRIALTDGGPANAVSPSTRRPPAARDCSGFWIEHPALVEPACFADSRIGAWSPDGTRFAAIGRSGNDWWVEVWTAAEGVRYHFDIPGSEVTLVGWSPDGAYLLVTWGVGV